MTCPSTPKVLGLRSQDQVTPMDEEQMNVRTLGDMEDAKGMRRLGKKQGLPRNFRFSSIWWFAVMLGCSWEYVLVSVSLLSEFIL